MLQTALAGSNHLERENIDYQQKRNRILYLWEKHGSSRLTPVIFSVWPCTLYSCIVSAIKSLVKENYYKNY